MEIAKIETLEEFERLKKENKSVLLKAGASWCGPCRVLENTLKSLDTEKLNGTIVAEFDVDEADELTNLLKIRNVPVMFYFVDGEEKSRVSGNIPSSTIYSLMQN